MVVRYNLSAIWLTLRDRLAHVESILAYRDDQIADIALISDELKRRGVPVPFDLRLDLDDVLRRPEPADSGDEQ
jgi:hypothetical protein